jgi:hypothetical protein
MSKGAKYVTSKENIGALISEVQKQNALATDQGELVVAQNFILHNIANNIADMTEGLIALKDHMIGERMKSLETDKEHQTLMEKLLEEIKKKPKTEEKKPEKAKGEFSWLGLAGTLIRGLIVGGLAFVVQYVKDYTKFLKKIGAKLGINNIIADVWNVIRNTFMRVKTVVGDTFGKLWGWIKNFFSEESLIGKLINQGKKAFKFIDNMFGGIFSTITKTLGRLGKVFGMMFEPILAIFKGGGGGFLDDALKGVSKFFDFFKPLAKFFPTIGKLLGKLAWPIQVIMSLWDTVQGAIDGWKKTEGSILDKILGAVFGGLKGLLTGLFGSIFDLLKDGVSWILKFFGFDNAAAILDSFSFSQIISDICDGFFNLIRGIKDFIVNLFTDPGKALDQLKSVGDWIQGFFKKILRLILPKPKSDAKWYDPANLVAKAIPDSVYEYAGLDPKTGEMLKEATGQQADLQAEQKGKEIAQAGAAAVNAGSTTVVNNNKGGTTAVIGAKTTKFDDEDMYARGGAFMGA